MRNAAGDHTSYKYIPAELAEAGIDVIKNQYVECHMEVFSHFGGKLHGWKFTRAWYYWGAWGPGLPMKHAEALHALVGDQVRVAGHCRCPSPGEWYGHRDATDRLPWTYHIDTQVGLNLFANVLRLWVENDWQEAIHVNDNVGSCIEYFIRKAAGTL